MSYYYSTLKKLTDEQRYFDDIAYLRSQNVPLTVMVRNHKNGYSYADQAKMHRQIKVERSSNYRKDLLK